MGENTNSLTYNDFHASFEHFLSQKEILSKIEKMSQSGKKTLLLSVDGHSEFQNRKIRFLDSNYSTTLATILNNHQQSEEQGVKKQLVDLLREQIQQGQFIFESRSSDGSIQAVTTPQIAKKLEKGVLKLISNKDHTTEKKYDSIEQLNAGQLEELASLVSILDKPIEEATSALVAEEAEAVLDTPKEAPESIDQKKPEASPPPPPPTQDASDTHDAVKEPIIDNTKETTPEQPEDSDQVT